MEPMTLESPVSSPSSPSPYLPGYLMGDPLPQPVTPAKTPRHISFIPGPATPNDSVSRFHKNQREKSGGPPTIGLFDTLDVSTSSLPAAETSTSSVHHTPQACVNTPVQHSASVDEGERWVTVFGFPPTAASAVLSQFSQVGHVLEHRFPGQGNWVTICYASKLDARRALAYNGKIMGSYTMVGVTPCSDYRQSGSTLKDMTNVQSCNGTPKMPQITRLSHRRLVTSPPTSPYLPSPRGSRPMGITSPTDTEVTVSQNTPMKSTSFVTKAVDFVFGW